MILYSRNRSPSNRGASPWNNSAPRDYWIKSVPSLSLLIGSNLHPDTAGGYFHGTHAGYEAMGAAPTRLPRSLVLHLIAQHQFPWLLTDESLLVHPLRYRVAVVASPSYLDLGHFRVSIKVVRVFARFQPVFSPDIGKRCEPFSEKSLDMARLVELAKAQSYKTRIKRQKLSRLTTRIPIRKPLDPH